MPENLLSPSAVKLFGREVTDLQLKTTTYKALGANHFLKDQLAADKARLARIYGFSFEGQYYELPKPALFLVHGEGEILARGSNTRSEIDTSGVMARDWEFSEPTSTNDIRMWEYDKGDFSIRLDIDSGQLWQILLEPMLRGGTSLSSGADLRSSGADARISGADARISGADLRRR